MFPGRQLFSGQKGGAKVGNTKRGKGCKIMAIGDAHGLPLAIHTEAAAPAEVKLVEATLQELLVAEKPLRLIADKAYDSDPLRERLLDQEMLLLAPHRKAAPSLPLMMGAGCGAIANAGRSNASSLGCITLDDWWCAGNTMPKISTPSSNSDVPSFFSGIYEMASSVLKRAKFSSVKPLPLSVIATLSVSGEVKRSISMLIVISDAPASSEFATASKNTWTKDRLGKKSLMALEVSMSITRCVPCLD